jgi:hypothetical protein
MASDPHLPGCFGYFTERLAKSLAVPSLHLCLMGEPSDGLKEGPRVKVRKRRCAVRRPATW